MHKNNFKNSCDHYKQKLMKDLDSIRDHALSNEEFKKIKPRSYKKHSKLIEKIEEVLHI